MKNYGHISSTMVAAALIIGGSASLAMAGSLKDDQTKGDEAPERVVLFNGYDASKGSTYVYQSILLALNGDYSKDGLVLRTYGSRSKYNDNSGGISSDGRGWQGDVMLGYHFNRPFGDLSVYLGVDYQDQKSTPDDPTNPVRGTDAGFKISADFETNDEATLFFSLGADYSTVFDTYWARARAGYNTGKVTFGPEFAVSGDSGYDAQRVGAFVSFKGFVIGHSPIEVTLSGGYQFVDGSSSNGSGNTSGIGGGEGAYGAVSLGYSF